MGKNRNNTIKMVGELNKGENIYTTITGANINMEGYDTEFFKHLENNIQAWIKYASASPNFLLTQEEIDYIQSHMQNSTGDGSVPSGFLTRVEKARHFEKHDYKVGDHVDDPALFRSYSRDQNGTLKYVLDNGDVDRPIVIYRTHGNVKHFDASQYDNIYEWETESFVEQGKMKITNIHTLEGDNLQNLPSELGLNNVKNNLNKLPKKITIVDVEQT